MIFIAGLLSPLTASASSSYAPSLRHLRSNASASGGRRLQTAPASQAQIVINSRGSQDRLLAYTGKDANNIAQFDVSQLPPGNRHSAGATFGDLNADGHLDMIRATNIGYTMVMYNDGSNGFPSSSYTTIPKTNPNARDYGVRVADVDNNGLKDIITGSWGEGHFVHKQTAPGAFSSVQLPVSTNVHYGFAVADFNGDSYPDIVFPHARSGVKLLLNDGAGNYPTATDLIAGGTNKVLMITEGDFDNDGDMDLVGCSTVDLPDKLYVNDGTGTFTEVILPSPANPDPTKAYLDAVSAGFADLNGDGHLDIVIGNYGNPNRMLLNDGSGNFPTSMDIPMSPTYTKIMKFGDVDGDGSVDMVIIEDGANGANGYLYLNNGSANFLRQTITTGLFDPWGLAVLGAGVTEENGGGSSVALASGATTSSSAPTLSPTTNPTASPSKAPTEAPAPYAPWEIHFLDIAADFSVSSVEEIQVTYEIGKGRVSNAELLQADCSSSITDVDIESTDSTSNKNSTFDTLTLSHSVDKTDIATSVIWNAAASQIDVCQVVQLKEGGMVIAEDKRVLSIDFDLSVDYTIDNAALAAETINAGNDTTSVDSYVEACKCGGDSFVCNTIALAPNDDLHICIRSVDSDVEIDFLDDMIISQDGASDLIVIETKAAKFPSFTSMAYVPASRGVVVKTRVPTNMFDYNSPGAVVSISGEVMMQLVGSSRRLQSASDASASEEDSFDFEVSLQREMLSEDDEASDDASSAFSTSGKSLVAFGAGIAGAFLMG